MKHFFNIKNRIKRKINLESLISNKKRLSKFYLSLLKSDKINIYDIGAGHRILNELINFDQISNIYLIDPNINESKANKKYLNSIKILRTHYYVAPIYNKNIKDRVLVNKINNS